MSYRPAGFFVEHPLGVLLHCEPQKQITFICPRINCDRSFTGTVREVYNAYKSHVVESDHMFELEDCGFCGCQHFPEFDGDCREDWERF